MKQNKSVILNTLRQILADGIKRIDNDECNENEVSGLLNRFNAEHQGYYNDNSLVTYDEGMRITGIRSRNKFRALCRLHCIEQKKINNMRVGFLRSEIEDMAFRIRQYNRAKQ